jgi:hypothetical protein
MRAFDSPTFVIPGLGVVCRLAVEEDDVRAAGILDGNGATVIRYGAIGNGELRAVGRNAVARVLDRTESARFLGGGALVLTLREERRALVEVAARCLFVVIVDDRDEVVARETLSALRRDVEELIDRARQDLGLVRPPPGSGTPGSGSGPEPAELQHVELGVTVPRRRPS